MKNDYCKDLAAKLSQLRHGRVEFSYRKLSKTMGLSVNTIYSFLNTDKMPHTGTCAVIKKFLETHGVS